MGHYDEQMDAYINETRIHRARIIKKAVKEGRYDYLTDRADDTRGVVLVSAHTINDLLAALKSLD